MNNLTTRKIVLGMLMTLVLAFSVQGVADALTLRISSGDLVTVAPNQEFTLRFSVVGLRGPVAVNSNTSRGSATDIEYADGTRTRAGDPDPITSNFTVIVDAGYVDGDTHYYTVTTTTTVRNTADTADVTRTLQTRNWLTESAAYYYNDESVAITTSPTIALMKGDTAVTGLVERAEESDERLSSSISLTGSHAAPAAYDITITDNTDAGDFDGDVPATRSSITFTVFVVGRAPGTAEAEWGFTGLTSTTERYKVGGDDFTDDAITTASTTHIRVEYSVIEGSGRLYVQRGTAPNIRKTSASRTITTSSAAVVHLDMGSSTNKVRASISGAAPVMATFIFGHPQVEIVSGNRQEGGFGGQLDDPLVVKVTDGRGRALSGLAADFDTTATGDPRFVPVPGTTVYTTTAAGTTLAAEWTANTRVATSSRPPAAEDIVVQTNSRGEASTYFQLGTTVTETSQTVTVMAGGAGLIVPPNFRFDVESGERRPTLSILSGNNQTTDENGDIDDPLVVVVRQDGRLKPGELVTFHTSKGTLIGRNEADDGDVTDKRVYGMTDGRGRAEVEYFQDPGEGSDTVTATISGTDPSYEREVVFGVNGGQGTRGPTPPPPPPTVTNTITIAPSTITGEPGDEVVITVTSDPSVRFVTLSSDDFADSLFSPQSGTTPFQSTLTLPDDDGEYDISATSAGLTSGTATVTVETGILGEISISPIGSVSNAHRVLALPSEIQMTIG